MHERTILDYLLDSAFALSSVGFLSKKADSIVASGEV
jgi:hypothetical protein